MSDNVKVFLINVKDWQLILSDFVKQKYVYTMGNTHAKLWALLAYQLYQLFDNTSYPTSFIESGKKTQASNLYIYHQKY